MFTKATWSSGHLLYLESGWWAPPRWNLDRLCFNMVSPLDYIAIGCKAVFLIYYMVLPKRYINIPNPIIHNIFSEDKCKGHAKAQTWDFSSNCCRSNGLFRSEGFKFAHWLATMHMVSKQLWSEFFNRVCHGEPFGDRGDLWLKFGSSFLDCRDSSENGEPDNVAT